MLNRFLRNVETQRLLEHEARVLSERLEPEREATSPRASVPEQAARVQELQARGYSIEQAAEVMGIDVRRAVYVLRRNEKLKRIAAERKAVEDARKQPKVLAYDPELAKKIRAAMDGGALLKHAAKALGITPSMARYTLKKGGYW